MTLWELVGLLSILDIFLAYMSNYNLSVFIGLDGFWCMAKQSQILFIALSLLSEVANNIQDDRIHRKFIFGFL
mgnify:CR=1 FL=1